MGHGGDNDLQPFYVLHKANENENDRKSIDRHEHLTMEAYKFVWSKLDSSIKDVLREHSSNVFNEIHGSIRQSFTATRSPSICFAQQIFTAFILTKNMEFVDDLLTFQQLGLHLKSHGCHVANLSSLDFMPKNGIGVCLTSVLRQLLMDTFDATDMSILAAWYREQENDDAPIVVIIDDMEHCCGSVLSDFIYMLSEWAVKIPIILLVGVATTLDAPRNVLASNALQLLCPCKFILGSPAERMDAIVNAALVKQCFGFSIGHRVADFLRIYFLNQDGTLTSFIRALKMACVQHFSLEPLSFMLHWLLVQEDNKRVCNNSHSSSLELMINNASDFPSHVSGSRKSSLWFGGVEEITRALEHCSAAGKFNKIQLLDLLCEALNPDLYSSGLLKLDNDYGKLSSDRHGTRPCSTSQKGGFIWQAVQKVRDLPATQLCQLFKSWEKLSMLVHEISDKVKEFQSLLKLEGDKSLKQELVNISKRHLSWTTEKGSKAGKDKVVNILEGMMRDYLQPIECKKFHEIVCFKNVDNLHRAIVGDPRKQIQVDLLELQKILSSSCCSWSNNDMHDTSIMYTLALEHGDLINLHDWYQSFKTVQQQQRKLKKRKKMHEPS